MTSLQRVVHLATTDEGFQHALQADSATALAQQGLGLDSEEIEILIDLEDLLIQPADPLADHFQDIYLKRPHWD